MKYYIFDLDGTIADSMGYWYGSFREDERYDHERMQQVRLAMKEKYAEIIQPRPERWSFWSGFTQRAL